MFELNDKVVYPGHGVAIIESILEKEVAGSIIRFFKLRFLYKDMTILVPLHNLESTGIRPLSDENMIKDAMDELIAMPDKKLYNLDLSPSGWNRRNKEYQQRIASSKLQEIAKIYRDLMHISLQKNLSFGEKSLLQMTEELLVQEVITVRNIDRTVFLKELRAPFKQFFTTDNPQSLFQQSP